MLSVLNSVLIIIIIFVIIINFILFRQAQKDITDLKSQIDVGIQKKLNDINLLQMGEFKDLDPLIKDYYKDLIVNTLFPLVWKRVNEMIVSSDLYKQVKKDPVKTKEAMRTLVKTYVEALDQQMLTKSLEQQMKSK